MHQVKVSGKRKYSIHTDEQMKQYSLTYHGKNVKIINETPGEFIIDDIPLKLGMFKTSSFINSVRIGNKSYNLYCKRSSETLFEIWINQYVFTIKIEDSRSRLLSQFNNLSSHKADEVAVKAPMPGLVSVIEVKQGDIVSKGKGLIVLEAMKMENEIKSSVEGIVKTVHVKERMTVEKDQLLLVLKVVEDN